MSFDYCKLSEITLKITKGTTPTTVGQSFVESGVNFIKSESIGYSRMLDQTKFMYIDDLTHEKLKRSQIKENDILFSMAGMFLGKTGIATSDNIPANTNQAVAIIRPNDKLVNFMYLYYWLTQKSVVQEVNSQSAQSAQPNINLKQIGDIKIRLPSLPEQIVIADTLSCLDDKIELNNRMNKTLEETAQAIFKSWFVDFEPFQDGEFVDSELGRIPKGWRATNIYHIANIIYGAPFASKQFNTVQDGEPIVRIRDLKGQELSTYTTEIHPKGYKLQPEDIVVGMDGEFRPYLWGNKPAWLNQRVCVFANKRPKGKAFLLFTIKPQLDMVEKTELATTVIHIGKKDFDMFNVLLPSDEVLDQFDELTATIVSKIVQNFLEIRALSTLRNSLLPKLMSGELRVPLEVE